MKILVIGNHTCGNRGDGAILRGLIEEIERQSPTAAIKITSRFPISSSYLLGREIFADPFSVWHKRAVHGASGRLAKAFLSYFSILVMLVSIRMKWTWLRKALPEFVKNEISMLQSYDAVIQVGGSFFVDLYGSKQFEYAFAVILAKKPLYLIGHSMGPFEGILYKILISTLLINAEDVILREPISQELIIGNGLPVDRISLGSDTAWLVKPTSSGEIKIDWLECREVQRAVVSITVRELSPFNKRLNIEQHTYEAAFAALVDDLMDAGYDVVATSTCTGIDSYHRDDRISALRISKLVKQKSRFYVLMDELNDVQLGQLFRQCDLVIGTRLHSAIIAMNFGVPAVAINYEHKSAGIMRQLDMGLLSEPVSALIDGTLSAHIIALLPRLDELRAMTLSAVALERKNAAHMVTKCLMKISSPGANI